MGERDRSQTISGSSRIWLVLRPGEEGEAILEASGNQVTIGRDEDCDLILEDPSVSRRHAVIRLRYGPTPVLEDLGSANGTYLNGKRIRPRPGFTPGSPPAVAELRGGEVVRVGDTSFIVLLSPPRREPPATGTST